MLYLVRHGQTDWNLEPTRCQGWADVPLNDAGRSQARDDGRRLAGRGIRRIVSSHLVRARETAEIIRYELEAADAAVGGPGESGPGESGPGASAGPLDLTIDERLAETARGRWQGRTHADIIAREPDAWTAYREHPETFRFPGGESFVEHQRRVLAAVRDAAADGRTTLLVTHGGSMRLVRAFLEGRGIDTFHEVRVPNGQVLEVPSPGLVERIDAFLAAPAGQGDAAARGPHAGCADGPSPAESGTEAGA
jgi:broad specificity phosphatase PhoE